jgi:hypothetical protein
LSIKIFICHDPEREGGVTGNNRLDNVSLDGYPISGVIRPPVTVSPLRKHIELIENDEPFVLDMNDYFRHPDGQSLKYIISNSNARVASLEFIDNQLVIKPEYRGGTYIRLEVKDDVNPPLSKSFYVLVNPAPVKLASKGFIFDFWSPDEVDGNFPRHMIFLQGEQADPLKDAEIIYAYTIPENEYSGNDKNNIGFPYRNTSRSRINGLNSNGISFINTGRSRDVGAAVLALDTRGIESFEMSWTASTIRIGSRKYSLSLQYRNGINGHWKTWKDSDGNPIDYKGADANWHSEMFSNIPFPHEIAEQPYVQIRWLYNYSGFQADSASGIRDMIGLNSISVNVFTSVVNEPDMISGSLKVYPNPSEIGRVNFSRMVTGQMFDILGRPVTPVLVNITLVDTSALTKGMYFFRTNQGEVVKIRID